MGDRDVTIVFNIATNISGAIVGRAMQWICVCTSIAVKA